eukprot:391117-Rhodomonas_salina.2
MSSPTRKTRVRGEPDRGTCNNAAAALGRKGATPSDAKAARWWLALLLAMWRWFAINGGWGAPDIDDDDEALFGDVDVSLKERVEARTGLRSFLLEGQKQWSQDGGVVVPDTRPERDARRIVEFVKREERRWPTHVIIGPFRLVDPELHEVLEETRRLEIAQLEHVNATGYHCGFRINAQGCQKLGLPARKIEEWTEGVDFNVDPALPHYSKGAYQIVYRTRDFIMMTEREFNKLLQWLIPVNVVPWIESRVMVVVRPSALEESGFKNRPVINKTASGLNWACKGIKFGLPTVLNIIKVMGPGAMMGKMDLSDFFYSFRVHPRRWTLMGVRHPVTGQSYVMPVLLMGFALSPPLACANSQLLTDIINAEMTARWENKVGHSALEHIPQSATRPAWSVGGPTTHTHVDDFLSSAWGEWLDELVAVAARVFELTCMTEKAKKQERGLLLVMLVFLFDSRTGVMRIPDDKCADILALLRSVLARARKGQSASVLEISSLGGKLTWACSAVVCGHFYLKNLRKLVVAVQDVLPSRLDRESFCIPLGHFKRALDELEWWEAVLAVGGGVRAWFVGKDGTYKAWRWDGSFGDEIPADVVQFATDASTGWGGGWYYELERRV